jgi:DNA-directed RNA polymerase specialized sigma24 family protein
MSTDYDFYDNQGDEWLVAALLSDDQPQRNAVAEYLMAKHNSELKKQLRGFSRDEIDETLSDVWSGFYQTLHGPGVQASIRQLLGGILRNKKADRLALRYREQQFEADEPIDVASPLDVESLVELRERLEYSLGLSYGNSSLTPCQQVVWTLEVQYQLPRSVMSRILGKSRGTLSTHMSDAYQTVDEQMRRQQDRPQHWHENPFARENHTMTESAVIVENFSHWLIPQLTPDEIAPLGVQQAELAQHYRAMLMVPRWKKGSTSGTDYGKLSLLLVRREAVKQWRDEEARVVRNPQSRRFHFPEACLVDLDVEDDTVALSVQTLVEIWPDLDALEHSDNLYLSSHKTSSLVPVTLGVWDPSLYFDPTVNDGGTAYDRWPFLPSDEEWTE